MDRKKSRKLVERLRPTDLRHLAECIEHAYTKPHYELAELVPVLVQGHHHIDTDAASRIKAVIRDFSSAELAWVGENIHTLLRD